MAYCKTLIEPADERPLDELCRSWEEQYRYGSLADRKRREALWKPFYTKGYREQTDESFTPRDGPGTPTRILIEQGLVTERSTVFEIACGAGDFAMTLAGHCRRVTAIDNNEAAVDLVRRRLARNHIANVTPVCASWDEHYPAEHHDLAVTAMCPAVCNLATLRAMENTADACALITVLPSAYDKVRKQIMNGLGLHPDGMVTRCQTFIDVLHALGRKPEVWVERSHTERTLTLDALLDQYTVYFEIFGVDRSVSVPFMRDYFRRNQKDGLLYDESQMDKSMIVWQTGK